MIDEDIEEGEDFATSPALAERPTNIIDDEVECFNEAVSKAKTDLKKSIDFLSKTEQHEIIVSIRHNLNLHYQNILVRYFQELLDDCYLKLLIEVIASGNPHRIQLSKFRPKIDIASCMLKCEPDDELGIPGSIEFSDQSFINNIWKAYKWESFKKRLELLFKSMKYTANQNFLDEIRKHVIVRNCLQHHEGRLDRDSLKQLGKDKIQMKNTDGTYDIVVWNSITIFEEELYSLCVLLKEFVSDFNRHVGNRIPPLSFQ